METMIPETRGPKTGSKMAVKVVPDGERAWIQARDRATQQAERATMSHAKMEEGPAIPAAIPGTTKIPEPMVPPTPRLTSPTRPRDFRSLVSSVIGDSHPG